MKRWLPFLFLLLAMSAPQSRGYAPAEASCFLHPKDGLGSTRFLTTTNATVANAFAYDAYGTLIASNGVPQTAYLYCGEQWDANLGFYYLRARYLNTGTGRFWTRDSFEGHQSDPLSLHRYLYCHADPVNRIDPSGQFGIGAVVGVAVAVWGVIEIGLTVYDAYDAASTIFSPTAPLSDKLISGGGLALGAIAPGGGYGSLGKHGAKALTRRTVSIAEKRALAQFSRAGEFGIRPFKELAEVVPKNSGLQKHHLIEQRLAERLGVKADDIPSIALYPHEHEPLTQAWLKAIARRNMDRFPKTDTASVDEIWDAAKEVYEDYPDLLQEIGKWMGRR